MQCQVLITHSRNVYFDLKKIHRMTTKIMWFILFQEHSSTRCPNHINWHHPTLCQPHIDSKESRITPKTRPPEDQGTS